MATAFTVHSFVLVSAHGSKANIVDNDLHKSKPSNKFDRVWVQQIIKFLLHSKNTSIAVEGFNLL